MYGSSKNVRAHELGIAKITEEDFLKILEAPEKVKKLFILKRICIKVVHPVPVFPAG
jgi:hypothetical protein